MPDTVEKLEEQISDLLKKISNDEKTLTRLSKKRDKLLKEQNENHFDDMEWLIKNPNMPGSYDALKKKIADLYGSEWEGVHPSGYHHDSDYKAIQKNFDFICRTYGHQGPDKIKANIRHFIDNYLGYFKPVMTIESRYTDKFPEMKVVGFKFLSRRSGLDYLCYNPETKLWYHAEVVYRQSNVIREFQDFETALDYIFIFAEVHGE